MPQPPFKRILLKLSGETLLGDSNFGIHPESCKIYAQSIANIAKNGTQVAVVIGGGNIFRGINIKGTDFARVPADQMGMLATMMNGLALRQAFENIGYPSVCLTGLECPQVADTFQWKKAQDLLNQGKILILIGGTGNSYFTTDTASSLRSLEIGADALLKATNVDGVYPADPRKEPGLTRYKRISYAEVLSNKLQIMDSTAISMCRDNKLPIYVFNKSSLHYPLVLTDLLENKMGTLIDAS